MSPYMRAATETFALTNLEAMAMGVPLVTFGVGGIRVCVPARASVCVGLPAPVLMPLCKCVCVCCGPQDYARHLINAYVVREMSGVGLARGMLTLALNSTLRSALAAGGRRTAHTLYDVNAVGVHGAAMLR